MKFYKIFSTVILLTFLGACQSEALIEPSQKEPSQPLNKLTVRASLPNDNETRAHIIYGYGDPDNRSKEIFVWDEEDEINIFNFSKLSECPFGVIVYATNVHGNTAEFTSIDNPGFRVEKGDTILAIYGEINREAYKDSQGNVFYDQRNIINIGVGTEANKPQIIETEPNQETTLSYMKDNLKMYDILIAEEDNKIPDINFIHLSAILRITLHNRTGKDLYPTKLEFKYPTTSPTTAEGDTITNPSFYNTTLYCSIDPGQKDCLKLISYVDDDLFGGSQPHTYNIGTTINTKENTDDTGEKILNGESYELYLSTVPRLDNDSFGEECSIHLIVSHDTDNPYVITIPEFKEVITAGKRYWFDLVATPNNTLVLKSQYNPENYQSNGNSGEENSNEETTPEN